MALVTTRKIRRFSNGQTWGCAAVWLLCSYAHGGVVGPGKDGSELPDNPLPASLLPGQAPAEEDASGTVSGLVVDVDGAYVSGAKVKLSSLSSATERTTLSNNEGTFAFDHVLSGPFVLVVTSPGFVEATSRGTLAKGQIYEAEPFALKLAPVDVVVEAVASQHDVAAEQVHLEEKQRLVGFVPNFFVSYNWHAAPLSTGQKFGLAFRNASDPGNLVLVGITAGIQQAGDDFSGYGQGAEGYGKRYGADLANLVVGTILGGAVLPSLFHQDPRYFYKGTGSIRARTLYAISTAVICRGDNGRRQPAWASVLGDLSAGAISNAYYPASDRNGARLTIENGLLGVAGDALGNIFQEFVLRKLTPSAKSQAQRMP